MGGCNAESNVKWVFLALSLLSEMPLAGQGYGEALAVGGGDVVVGESQDETSPGYVYVYRKDSGGAWVEVQRLEASNSAIGDRFGRTVTLSGDQLLVGSTVLQAIYVFEKDGSDKWRETQILRASDTFEGKFHRPNLGGGWRPLLYVFLGGFGGPWRGLRIRAGPRYGPVERDRQTDGQRRWA